jgi:hypothetical protein
MDELAALLSPDPEQPVPADLRLLRGKVTAVSTTAATIHLGDPAVLYLASYHTHTTLAVGDVVSALFGGGMILVLGKIR